jgi:hypothetical protein
MKVLTLLVLVQVLPGSSGMNAAQSSQPSHDAKPAFSMAISTSRSVVNVGSPLLLTLETTNTSDHDVLLGTAARIGVLDSEGKPVPETRYGMKLHGTEPRPVPPRVDHPVPGPGGGGLGPLPLHPGETTRSRWSGDLSREYDLSKAGTYMIQVRRWDPYSGSTVESNVLTVTLVGSPPPPQRPATSFSLYITDDEDSVKPGDKIVVHIEVTNTSDHDIVYVPNSASVDIQIRDARGNLAPLTEAGREKRKQLGMPGGNPHVIKPGDTLNLNVEADGLYDLQPGDYTLQILQFDKETNTWVKSNALTITVTP